MARIGIDARLSYYTQGGIAQYTQRLIRALAEFHCPHEYVILHSRKDTRDLTVGASQRRVKCWTPAHHRLERLALAVEIAPLRLDVLHSPDFIPPRDGRQRAVITVPDLGFLHFPQFLTADSRRYYNGQIGAAVKRADHIIAISEATRQDILKLLDVHPDKVTTVWLAAGEQFQPASPEIVEQARLRYKLPDSYILFVSTIEPRKNIVGLLRAYACLRADIPDAPPLVLAGKRGWLYEDIMALYEEMRFGPDVIWLEDFSAVDLPAIYSGAVLFCLPSFYEGFGLTPLEAMACGTPVIVSDRASLPEVVGDAGLLVDPDSPEQIAERLARMLVNSDLADDLRSRGIARARQFTWRSTAQKTLAVYDRVLET